MRLMRSIVAFGLALGTVMAPASALVAQESRPVAVTPPPKTLTPLKITVVIARYQGEKKTASLPFTLWVNANDVHGTSLRMNQEVPVPQNTVSGGTNQPVQSYSYRSIGTNIDTSAEPLDDSRFVVNLAIQDSQVFSDASKPAGGMAGLPSFQSFSSSMHVILKDGQTSQYTTATDKITSEVVKVDVTLNVIK